MLQPKLKFILIILLLCHPLYIFLSLLSTRLLTLLSLSKLFTQWNNPDLQPENLSFYLLCFYHAMVTTTVDSSLSPDMKAPVHLLNSIVQQQSQLFVILRLISPHEYSNSFLQLLVHWREEPIINQGCLFILLKQSQLQVHQILPCIGE